ncbi:hypothetical protein BDZ91DRAFT_746697 [Kalaharituber pfeilii]|nr:hypothetical protein BDZ91DRAFT_746697 [Kalaharituber pfeilii]
MRQTCVLRMQSTVPFCTPATIYKGSTTRLGFRLMRAKRTLIHLASWIMEIWVCTGMRVAKGPSPYPMLPRNLLSNFSQYPGTPPMFQSTLFLHQRNPDTTLHSNNLSSSRLHPLLTGGRLIPALRGPASQFHQIIPVLELGWL